MELLEQLDNFGTVRPLSTIRLHPIMPGEPYHRDCGKVTTR